MLVDLSRQAIAGGVDALPDWINVTGSEVTITGDDTLDRQTYVRDTPDGPRVSTDLDALIVDMGGEVLVSDQGISHLLGTGFTPLPETIYEGVWRLGAGDTMAVDPSTDPASISVTNDYPWMSVKSRHDSVPSAARLLDLITASVERRLEPCGNQGVLMMSSGLDSVTLAIAVADLGYDIPCVTYQAAEDNREHEFAARFCRKLGLRHQTVAMSTDREWVRRLLTSFFESSVMPSADHAVIPFVMTLASSGVTDGAVIDGSGNDGYMGYVTSRRRKIKRVFRIRGPALQRMVAKSTRIDSRFNYLARSRSGAAWPGRNLRHHEIAAIYAAATDPESRWHEEDRRLAGWSDHDRAEANMLRQLEGARTLEKARLAASASGMEAVLPYCDREIAEYAFHLPQSSRYSGGEEKILLRQIVDERLDYGGEGVPPGFFSFDGAAFFVRHAEFVRDEILSCALWEPAVGPLVDRWLGDVQRRPMLFHGLLNLFVISGWHNHSRYLVR